jgi:flagellar biosynthesis protein
MPENSENIEQQIQKEIESRGRKIAVALNYNTDKPESAPLITATGKGKLAEEIIRIAEENHVPLYEDRSLADTEVPPELYVLVAEVLAFVYKLDRMARKRESVQEQIQKSTRNAP